MTQEKKTIVGCKNCYPRSESWTRWDTIRLCSVACEWSWDCCASDRSWFWICLRDRRIRPSVAQLVESLTVVLYTCLVLSEINWSLVRIRPLGNECGECDNLPSRNFTTLLCGCCIGVCRISQSGENWVLYAPTTSFLTAIEWAVYTSPSLISNHRSSFRKIVSVTVDSNTRRVVSSLLGK